MTPRRVLVVDDDAAMRDMVVSMLQESGIHARSAASADEAVEVARKGRFDVILSDVRMPGKDAFDLLRELEKHQPDTPVILMTAFGDSDDLSRALRAGAFDYLMKPFSRQALLAALEWAFETPGAPLADAEERGKYG